jgi:hypothetical protein
MSVSFLLLVYGFYASICGNYSHKCVLSSVYVLYAAFIGILGIIVLAFNAQIEDALRDLWIQGRSMATRLENDWHCKDWDNKTSLNNCTQVANDQGRQCCRDWFVEKFGSVRIGVGVGLIVLCLLLIIGDIFTWKWVCSKLRDDGTREGSTATAPLTYSW